MLDTLAEAGLGSIAFTPLAQGLLTNKYLDGLPEGSRAMAGKSLDPTLLSSTAIERLNSLNEIAQSRDQTLAQMAIAWVLKDTRVTSALIGASRPEQIEDCVGSLSNLAFSDAELAEINDLAFEGGINLWAQSSEDV